MADQDFKINVITGADLTGIRQVDAGLDKILKRQAEAEAKWARSPINPKNQTGGGIAGLGGGPPTPPSGGVDAGVGLTGMAVGLGTIITLLTSAVNKWKAFNDEQDKWAEGMINSQEKSRAVGLEVADMLDALKSSERNNTEPLQQSFGRLTQKVTQLKTELKLAFSAGAYDDVKRYAAALAVVESQLNRVTAAIEKAASAKREFESSAFEAQAKEQEKAGDQAEAKESRRIEEGLKRGIPLEELKGQTPVDLLKKRHDELAEIAKSRGITEAERKAAYDAAQGMEPGIAEKERKDKEDAAAKEAQRMQDRLQGPPTGLTPQETIDYFKKGQGAAPEAEAKSSSPDVVQALQRLESKFDRYWS